MLPIDKKIALALRDTPKLISATAAIMEKLVIVLTKEVDVVLNRKMKEHPAILKEKQKWAMDYRANMKSLAAQPDILNALSADAKNALREMARRLAEAADLNARILRAAVDATRQLIQNVIAMVRTEAMPRQTYQNSATAHLQLGVYSPTCKPVAVSRMV